MSPEPVCSNQWHVGLIGYGEVGRILAEDLRKDGVRVSTYDIKLGGAQAAPLREHGEKFGVALAASHADLAAQADFIVSAVTASQAVPVAQAAAPAIKQGAWFLDFNSASPDAKKRAAALIDGAGGRYVEGAVMTSVPPYRIKVPLLLGGPGARELAPLLIELGFAAKVASEELGVSSAVKMCRSIMIKGLEAMVIESFTTGVPMAWRTRCWLRSRKPFPASTGKSRAPISSSASSSTAGGAARRCARSPKPCARSG